MDGSLTQTVSYLGTRHFITALLSLISRSVIVNPQMQALRLRTFAFLVRCDRTPTASCDGWGPGKVTGVVSVLGAMTGVVLALGMS